MKKFDTDMRDAFFNELYDIAAQDSRLVIVTSDMGARSLEKFSKDFSSQYFNVGIAEQNMVSVSAGLALGGKIVFMYAIAPFATLRCYEQIKVDLCCMHLSVTSIGIGVGFSVPQDGPTHYTTEDIAIMRALPGMTILNPSDGVMTKAFARIAYEDPGPKYVRLDKEVLPLIYHNRADDFSDGLTILKAGCDLTIIATGIMVHKAFKVVDELAKHSIDAGIVDLYRIKPINEDMLLAVIEQSKRIVTLEENSIIGGIGSIVSEILVDNGKTLPFKRIAVPDEYYFENGDREWIHTSCALDVDSVAKRILNEVQNVLN